MGASASGDRGSEFIDRQFTVLKYLALLSSEVGLVHGRIVRALLSSCYDRFSASGVIVQPASEYFGTGNKQTVCNICRCKFS